MDEKETNLTPEQENEAVKEEKVTAQDNLQDGLEEKNGVKYETNDNWQFEAEAPTLNDDVFVGEIPAAPAKNVKPEKTVAAQNSADTVTINKSVFKIIPAVILIIAVAAVLIVLGIRYYTVPNGKEGDKMNPGSVVVTVGNTDISIGMYNYYYYTYVNNYLSNGYISSADPADLAAQKTTDEDGKEITWLQLIQNQTINDIKDTVVFYEKAVKDGLTITDDQQETIDDMIENLETSASEAGLSVDEYIHTNIGEYVSEDTLRLAFEQYFLATTYKGKYAAEEKITEEEIEAYLNDHSVDYYQIEFSFLVIDYDSTSDETKKQSVETAKKYMDKVTDRASIEALVPELYKSYIDSYAQSLMSSDSTLTEKEANKEAVEYYLGSIDAQFTGANLPFDNDIKNWLFDSSTKIGSKNYYIEEETNYIYVILKTNQPELIEDETYSVRHILIADGGTTDETTGTTTFTDEEWAANEKKASEVLKEYEDGDKTELSFALLAEKYTADTASTSASGSYGGLYEAQALGANVSEFEDWATDENRQYGDTGIVKTQFGYHIMFFINDCPSYKSSAISAVRTEKLEKIVEETNLKTHNAVMEKAGAASSDTAAAE